MNRQEYIYRVSFKNEQAGDNTWVTDYYFTSLAAIYEQFSSEQIGCKVERLWNLKITPDSPYIGHKCTISKEPITRKKRQQNNNTGI